MVIRIISEKQRVPKQNKTRIANSVPRQGKYYADDVQINTNRYIIILSTLYARREAIKHL